MVEVLEKQRKVYLPIHDEFITAVKFTTISRNRNGMPLIFQFLMALLAVALLFSASTDAFPATTIEECMEKVGVQYSTYIVVRVTLTSGEGCYYVVSVRRQI